MPKKKHRAAAPSVRIETRISDILVARSRSAEPYLHVFSVSPENVTQEHLGRLMGVFSVSDRSDSSAYIGNVIASVAKKEYFANTRRGAVEGFEASLHRANLALSEIVKNGDTRFMGHLHGVLAAIEGDQVHFSVTGSAAILLFRDGALMDIGEGLASEEAATHPLKTFVEISSGRLLPGDCLLLISPEIFTLFSPRELAQNARRLVPAGKFTRFLETAMVNELKTGSALVITVTEKQARTKPKVRSKQTPKKAKKKETNFFSERAFREAAEKRAEHFLEQNPENEAREEKGSETIEAEKSQSDSIHVEGDAPPQKEEHPLITALQWKAEDAMIRLRRNATSVSQRFRERLDSTLHTISRTTRKRIRGIGYAVHSAIRQKLQYRGKRLSSHPRKKQRQKKKKDEQASISPETNPILRRALEVTGAGKKHSATGGKSPTTTTRDVPTRQKNLKRTWDSTRLKVTSVVRSIYNAVVPTLRNAFKYLGERFLRLPVKWRLISLALVAFLATFAVLGIRNHITPSQTGEEAPVIIVEEPEPAFPPEDENNASLADIWPVPNAPTDIITPVFLGDRLFAVTKTGITETSSETFTALPADSQISLATGMDDLSLIFFLTEKGELFSYSPANETYTRNEIDLPDGFRSAGIGTFLTYLYLLDSNTGTMYRFPRAEGGFGERSTWNREPIEGHTVSLAINSAIYTVSGNDILSLFRGRPTEGFSLEQPAVSLSVTALCAHEEIPERFVVLDAPTKRVLLYDEDGTLIRQYFHESFADMTSCSLDETGIEIAVSSSETIFTFSLEE